MRSAMIIFRIPAIDLIHEIWLRRHQQRVCQYCPLNLLVPWHWIWHWILWLLNILSFTRHDSLVLNFYSSALNTVVRNLYEATMKQEELTQDASLAVSFCMWHLDPFVLLNFQISFQSGFRSFGHHSWHHKQLLLGVKGGPMELDLRQVVNVFLIQAYPSLVCEDGYCQSKSPWP